MSQTSMTHDKHATHENNSSNSCQTRRQSRNTKSRAGRDLTWYFFSFLRVYGHHDNKKEYTAMSKAS